MQKHLQNGGADIIGMARQALADPDWFRKVRLGRGDEVHRTYTNYCEALDQTHRQVTCKLWDRKQLENPECSPLESTDEGDYWRPIGKHEIDASPTPCTRVRDSSSIDPVHAIVPDVSLPGADLLISPRLACFAKIVLTGRPKVITVHAVSIPRH